MAENILNNGLETCKEIKATLEELAAVKARAEEARNAVAQGEKSVKTKEKAIKDEIDSTLKKRKEEIEKSFDSEITTLKLRIKAVQEEKTKDKNQQQAQRIGDETAELCEKIREQKLEIRSIFKRDGVSNIFNTEFFYSLFLPRTLGEVLILILAILVSLIAIPSLIYFLLIPEASRREIWLVLIEFACIIVFIGGYMLISKLTKVNHRETFVDVAKIRRDIRANKKEIKSITRHVRKDKDESKYDLGQYDAENDKLTKEIDDITEQKKAALKEFENETKQMINDQITEKNQPELNELKEFVVTRQAEEKTASDRAKELGLLITKQYEPLIGKADLNVETLDKLIVAIESGKANNIAEALTYIKEVVTAPEAPAAQPAPVQETPAEAAPAETVPAPEAAPAFDNAAYAQAAPVETPVTDYNMQEFTAPAAEPANNNEQQ